ncbi:PREDICTED: uncharacterized protein LOC106784106 [Polistes canadensis]|uniref:uncharacterized protein LOC106784106 n=1 Tax=Polistes canadensis TaxID=91411 RepID=UPI000718D6EE|nr:PREDICTED: uncharacterized protein LOC106784106 [Polistes canadensis]
MCDLYEIFYNILDPIVSAPIFWIKNNLQWNQEFNKPILHCTQCKSDEINASNIDKMWKPISLDLISPKLEFKIMFLV